MQLKQFECLIYINSCCCHIGSYSVRARAINILRTRRDSLSDKSLLMVSTIVALSMDANLIHCNVLFAQCE